MSWSLHEAWFKCGWTGLPLGQTGVTLGKEQDAPGEELTSGPSQEEGAGVERVYQEQTSATGPRKALTEAIDYARDGDTLVVTKLDRLARSVAALIEITKQLEAKGTSLRVLNLNLDTDTPTGKLK